MVLGQAPWLSCMIRFGLRLSIEVVFIPHGRPQRNGAIEYFNGYKSQRTTPVANACGNCLPVFR
jgi:hypothetical protein